MKNIGDVFEQNKIGKKLRQREKKEAKLFSSWRRVAAEICFSHTENMSLKNGVLFFFFGSQVCVQELMMRDKKELAEAMAAQTGYIIGTVKIQSGGKQRQ